MSTTVKNPAQFTTGVVRLSYVAFIEPKSFKDGKPKFGSNVLIPKTDTATKEKIDEAVEFVEVEASKPKGKWEGKKPKVYKDPVLRDGDDYADENPENEAYRGHWYMNAKSDNEIPIVGLQKDKDGKYIRLDPKEAYSGCYARVNVTIFAFNAEGSKGLACALNSVQKVRDGENLGGRSSANPDDDFAEEFEPGEDFDDSDDSFMD